MDITYSVAEDTADVPRGEATYVLNANSAYTLSSMTSVSLEVVDNDPTGVVVVASDAALVEGDSRGVTMSLGRGLVSGEALVVPLTFGGTATRGTDYTLEGTPGRGVSVQNLNSGSASVTFTGPETGETVRLFSMILTAETDDVAEPDGETVEIGPGTLNENSGTGLDGGASGTSRVSFSILDPVPNAVNLSVSDDGDATEGGDALTITATLDRANATGAAISIPIQADVDGTTAQAADYTVASSISIANNAQSGTTSFTATDDDVAESIETVLMELGGTLPDGVVSGEANDVGISITDNDTAGLVISPTSLGVAEGDDASYTVELATLPTGTVTVAITVPAGTDLTLDTTSLTFSTSTWNTAQTVTVTAGEDDDTTDDTATLTHEASGGGYDNLGRELAVTVTDNDAAGLVISPTALEVDEGDDDSYTVKLAAAPTNTVTVAITVPAGTDLTLDTTSLTFSTSTWDDAQTVTVSAGEDDDTTDDTATLAHAASGGGYDDVEADLAVTVSDDDTAGLVLSSTSLGVAEGDDASYTVKLATQPSSTVTVAVTGHSGTDLTLDTTSLTFSTSTWDDAQTVTVSAGEDDDTTDDTATLAHAASGGGYDDVEEDLAVTVTDNDMPGLVLSPTSLEVDEGDDASYTVKLATPADGDGDGGGHGPFGHRPDAGHDEPYVLDLDVERRADGDGFCGRRRRPDERHGDADAHGLGRRLLGDGAPCGDGDRRRPTAGGLVRLVVVERGRGFGHAQRDGGLVAGAGCRDHGELHGGRHGDGGQRLQHQRLGDAVGRVGGHDGDHPGGDHRRHGGREQRDGRRAP